MQISLVAALFEAMISRKRSVHANVGKPIRTLRELRSRCVRSRRESMVTAHSTYISRPGLTFPTPP